MTKLRLKLVVVALVAVLFTSQLAAAQSSYPAPIPADQKVTINFYSYNLASVGIGAEGTKQLMSEFMAKFPNITVEGIAADSDNILARVQADLVANNPVDVAQLTFTTRTFIIDTFPVKAMEDIAPPAEIKEHYAGMSANGLKLGQRNDKTYGLAYTFSTPVLFYNADIFKAAGLDPEKPPKTWAEVKQYAEQIKKNAPQFDGVFIAGFGAGQGDWMIQALIRSNGGRVLSEDGKRITFGEPEAVEAIQMWQDLVRAGVHPKVNSTEGYNAFSGGKVGMMLQTSAVQAPMIKAAEGKWTLRAAKMPAYGDKPTKPTNSGSALFILAADPVRQRAAWEFVKFVTSERGYTIITSKIGYLPLRPGIVDDPQYLKEWVEKNPLVRPNLEQLDNLEPSVSFPGPNFQQIRVTLYQAVEEAVFGSGEVKQVMSAAQDRAQALLPK